MGWWLFGGHGFRGSVAMGFGGHGFWGLWVSRVVGCGLWVVSMGSVFVLPSGFLAVRLFPDLLVIVVMVICGSDGVCV